MADAPDLGSGDRKVVGVRVPSPAPMCQSDLVEESPADAAAGPTGGRGGFHTFLVW